MYHECSNISLFFNKTQKRSNFSEKNENGKFHRKFAASGNDGGAAYWRDDEIVVDRDGIPHFTGAVPSLRKEYRRRVPFDFGSLEGSGDYEGKVKKSLSKKRWRTPCMALPGKSAKIWSCIRGSSKRKKSDCAVAGIEKALRRRRLRRRGDLPGLCQLQGEPPEAARHSEELWASPKRSGLTKRGGR